MCNHKCSLVRKANKTDSELVLVVGSIGKLGVASNALVGQAAQPQFDRSGAHFMELVIVFDLGAPATTTWVGARWALA